MSQKQQSFIFTNGIDHRLVAISKATEELNLSFRKFLTTVARIDSLVSLSFDKVGLQFKVETSLNFPKAVASSEEPEHVGPQRVENKKAFTFLSDTTLDHIGVIVQHTNDAGEKVITLENPVNYVTDSNPTTGGLNQKGKDPVGEVNLQVVNDKICRFFIDPNWVHDNWKSLEDNIIFNQDIANYSNYIVKADKNKEGKSQKSINLLVNFYTILNEWYILAENQDGMSGEVKTNYLKTMEGLRLFLDARKTDRVYPDDLHAFLSHDAQPQFGAGLNLRGLVWLANPTNLTPETWKFLKPLFAQYLNKQTGSAFADSLRSFWKPSEMERLKLEAVSCFETKPQGKGNLGKSKQKKNPKGSSEKGKQKAKEAGKDQTTKQSSHPKKGKPRKGKNPSRN